MIYRTLTEKLLALSQQFPIVGVVGPRQSGKTTLVKELFSHLPYVSLEDLDQRFLAQNDTRATQYDIHAVNFLNLTHQIEALTAG